MPNLSHSAANCERVKGSPEDHFRVEQNARAQRSFSTTRLTPVALWDVICTGTGGQKVQIASVQLASGSPETRCGLAVKELHSVSSGGKKNNTFLAKYTLVYSGCSHDMGLRKAANIL